MLLRLLSDVHLELSNNGPKLIRKLLPSPRLAEPVLTNQTSAFHPTMTQPSIPNITLTSSNQDEKLNEKNADLSHTSSRNVKLHSEEQASNKTEGMVVQNESNSVLILAGDIGNPMSKIYKKFLTEMAHCYDKVFIITGNHEYYQSSRKKIFSMDDVDKMARLVTESIPNVHFLQRNSYIYI